MKNYINILITTTILLLFSLNVYAVLNNEGSIHGTPSDDELKISEMKCRDSEYYGRRLAAYSYKSSYEFTLHHFNVLAICFPPTNFNIISLTSASNSELGYFSCSPTITVLVAPTCPKCSQ